jgi:hypothetical protein
MEYQMIFGDTAGTASEMIEGNGGGRRYALLIEDKVGAEAQPEQCNRYFKRGEIGIEKKEYEEFFVFICASAEYVATNEEAKHYPYSMLHNSIKSNWTLEQLQWKLYDAGSYKDWDGLTNLFVELVNANEELLKDSYIKRWYKIAREIV